MLNAGMKDALNNLLYLAQVNSKNKDYEESAICYRKLIVFQPSNLEFYVDLAGTFEERDQIDSATNILNIVLKIDSNRFSALSKMGLIYGKYLNDLNKSLEYLLRAYSLKDDDGALLQNIGVAYGLKKNYELSIKFLKKALIVEPDNSNLYDNLAQTYSLSGDNRNAEKCRTKATELSNQK